MEIKLLVFFILKIITKQITKSYSLVQSAHPYMRQHHLVKTIHKIFLTAQKHHYRVKKLDMGPEWRQFFGKDLTAEELNKWLDQVDYAKDIETVEKIFQEHFPEHAQRQKQSKKARKNVDQQNQIDGTVLPGQSGMPFATASMYGPHFHPPTVITTKEFSNNQEDPIIQQASFMDLSEQNNLLEKLESSLKQQQELIMKSDSDVKNSLQDQLEKILRFANFEDFEIRK